MMFPPGFLNSIGKFEISGMTLHPIVNSRKVLFKKGNKLLYSSLRLLKLELKNKWKMIVIDYNKK